MFSFIIYLSIRPSRVCEEYLFVTRITCKRMFRLLLLIIILLCKISLTPDPFVPHDHRQVSESVLAADDAGAKRGDMAARLSAV